MSLAPCPQGKQNSPMRGDDGDPAGPAEAHQTAHAKNPRMAPCPTSNSLAPSTDTLALYNTTYPSRAKQPNGGYPCRTVVWDSPKAA